MAKAEFGIYVNGVRHGCVTYTTAKAALADALDVWKQEPTVRPEVVVRRLDGLRAVHKLPRGRYVLGKCGWERAIRTVPR